MGMWIRWFDGTRIASIARVPPTFTVIVFLCAEPGSRIGPHSLTASVHTMRQQKGLWLRE